MFGVVYVKTWHMIHFHGHMTASWYSNNLEQRSGVSVTKLFKCNHAEDDALIPQTIIDYIILLKQNSRWDLLNHS